MKLLLKMSKKLNYRIKSLIFNSIHRNLLEKKIRKYSKQINRSVLDIWSKSRRYDFLIKGNITAIEIKKKKKKNILFGDITNIPFWNWSFDNILCLEVIEYVENYKKAISELSRVLKKDWFAYVSIPFMYSEHKDSIRLTRNYLEKLFQSSFSKVYIENIGNITSIYFDGIRQRFLQSNRIVKYIGIIFGIIFKLFFLPSLIINKNINIASGYFIVLKK